VKSMSGKICYMVRTANIEGTKAIADLGRRTFAATFSSDSDDACMKPDRLEAE